jgi:hypothetical protein
VYLQRNVGSSFAGFGISGVVAVQPMLYSPLSTDDWAFGFDNGSSVLEAMRIKSNGNVGIGTTNPICPLSLGTAIAARKLALYDNGATFYGLGMDGANIHYEAGGSGGHQFYTNVSTLAMTITSGGYIGIGVMAPASALSVLVNPTPVTIATANQITICEASNNSGYRLSLGYASVSGTFYSVVQSTAGGSGAALLLNPSGGAVGIAKTPAYALDIAGDCNVTGSFRINGSPISGGGITTQSNVTGSRAQGTVYQNTTGKPMFVSVTSVVNANSYMQLQTDNSNPPSTIVCAVTNSNTSLTATMTTSGWVIPGAFYRAFSGGGTLSTWIEWT